MKRTWLYTLLIIAIVFNACSVSKDIALPAPALPVQYRGSSSADTQNIATIPWKNFFANNDLLRLIDSALANNSDMQIALKNIEAAQLLARQSRLGYLPEARLQATGSITRPSDNSLNGLSLGQFLGRSYVEDYSLNLALSWEADVWGKIRNQQSKALAGYLKTEEARKAIQSNLVATVASSYYQLLMLDAQVAIAKKNVLLNDSIIRIINLQYNAGQVTALALQQATAQRLAASELIPQLERQVTLEENYLSVLSGVAPASIPRSGTIYDAVYGSLLTTGVPSALLANRPDVKARELDLTIANANTGIAKAALYPSFGITAAGGVNSFLASNWFNVPASLFASAIGGITQPLFQQGKLKTQYQVSAIEREKTIIAFRQSVLNAAGEVSNALVKVEKTKEQQKIAQEKVLILQQGIGNAKMLFANGMANYLEVITAQGNVLQGELSLAQLQKEQSDAVIELYRSLGGGWK
ncbi:TolC family protein [Sediminibacterium roseum]|uniref:TolC family protein n=1 Tax=Sediminibacterium roseum TaxID=1978412 RepID=A0ABW9ZZ05_9BACT|nr:TolC family protein [Sediminibacterium roseum]NCI50952.1 TolC family protein [Sediminibacterium roseum]